MLTAILAAFLLITIVVTIILFIKATKNRAMYENCMIACSIMSMLIPAIVFSM